ncbi:hypothetical protein L1049_022834 [Liquidambar formosana]|uniref:Uncharacterized protein n=1 Tax=Liquidambar formosana TaxID=63359 RepID=A0AAP0REG7_LIQFO
MLPHAYTTDSLSKSQDLAAVILSASSPPQIAAACSSTLSFLHHLSPDQSRWFFSLTFPTLICKLFGFDDSASVVVVVVLKTSLIQRLDRHRPRIQRSQSRR